MLSTQAVEYDFPFGFPWCHHGKIACGDRNAVWLALKPGVHLKIIDLTHDLTKSQPKKRQDSALRVPLSPPTSLWCYVEEVEWEELCRWCRWSPFSGCLWFPKLTVSCCHFSPPHPWLVFGFTLTRWHSAYTRRTVCYRDCCESFWRAFFLGQNIYVFIDTSSSIRGLKAAAFSILGIMRNI